MGTRFFSTKDRPFHLGPYPLERLKRVADVDLGAVPAFRPLEFRRLNTPHSLVNAMGDYQAMMDVLRDGDVNPTPAHAPADPVERARHMKAFGYFQDASMMGICRMPGTARLVARVPAIDEVSIGHALFCDALTYGMHETVQRYLAACRGEASRR